MKDRYLLKMRNRALYEAYVKGISEHRFPNEREAVDFARRQPAPQFYMSSWRLTKYFIQIGRDRPMNRMNPNTRRKVRELWSRYLEYMRGHQGDKLSRIRVCELLVEQPAPEFYVCYDLAKKIIAMEKATARERLCMR